MMFACDLIPVFFVFVCNDGFVWRGFIGEVVGIDRD